MKRIIALAMCVMMLATLAVGTSAAGNILFTDDFTNGFSANNWILEGNNFFFDDVTDGGNPCLATYADGVICQAEFRSEINGNPRWYTNCAYSIRMQIRDYDGGESHSVGLWWRDDFGHDPDDTGLEWELGEIWHVVVDADNMIVKLQVESEETSRAEAPATGVEVGGDWFNLGWKVTPGNMSVYLDGEKIIDYSSDEISAARPSPFLLMNGDCYAAYDDIVIADIEYDLFNEGGSDVGTTATDATDATTDDGGNVGDVTNDNDNQGNVGETTTTKETTTRIESEVVTNDKGETSVVTKVVTEATTTPAAQTNTNRPTGGSSTATGDSTFVVIAVMVAVLGCAVAVKKVNAK